jgi:hypothetical protein
MSQFEFVFSLFGLLLGLSLAEVLSGFGKAVKARARVRIGWLTPLLGVLVMLDLTSFWTTAWSVRDTLPVNYFTLMVLLGFTGAYYIAANLVFPEEPDRCPDFDVHYWASKKLVVGAMFALNIPSYVVDWTLGRNVFLDNPFSVAIATVFMLLLVVIFLAKGHRLNLVLLSIIIALYPLGSLRAVLKAAAA